MADTVFVMGAGGSIYEMDIPRDPHGVERFEADLAKGNLRVIDSSTVEKADSPGGGYVWRVAAEPAPKAKGGRKPKPDTATAEGDTPEGETTPADEADEGDDGEATPADADDVL